MDVVRADKGWLGLIGRYLRVVSPRANDRTDLSRCLNASAQAAVREPSANQLSDAIDACRGTRVRVLQLVIVEQTLLKNIGGGLNAVPAEVLSQAIAQLVRLPKFAVSVELQLLCQRMRQIVKASGYGSFSQSTARIDRETDINFESWNPISHSDGVSPASSNKQRTKPVGEASDPDDDFQDTQAFEDDRELVLPMPTSRSCGPMDRGTAMRTGGRCR